MGYVVKYKHPGLGKRESSVWGARVDAEAYRDQLPASYSDISIVETSELPEIFRHCGGTGLPPQAIGGRCFSCRKELTRDDARAFMETGAQNPTR